jgi:hypothetical protein
MFALLEVRAIPKFEEGVVIQLCSRAVISKVT